MKVLKYEVIKRNGNEGGAMLIVLVLLGMISMLAGLISVFTKGDAAKLKGSLLRDELRAPMRLEISNMWYQQFIADDEWCSQLNFLDQVSGITQDGPSAGELQFIGNLDNLSFNIDSKVKTYLSLWKDQWHRALAIKVLQKGPSMESADSLRKRIPVAFTTEWRWSTKEEAQAYLDDLQNQGKTYWLSKWVNDPPLADNKIGHWEKDALTMDNWPYPFDLDSTKRYTASVYPLILEVDTGFSPIACYGETSSRNICMDWGGLFNTDPPAGESKCKIP